jgi:hypothetical protein
MMDLDYEAQVRNLKAEHELRIAQIKQDTNEKNKVEMDKALFEQEKSMHEKMERLKADYQTELKTKTEAYHEKLGQVQRLETELRKSEADRIRLETENSQAQRADQELHTELATTQAQLKQLKTEYQHHVKELQKALDVSKEHLQHNYELISTLKSDKTKLMSRVEDLKKELTDHDAGLRVCSVEKKDLQHRLKTLEIDGQEYARKMAEIVKKEQHHQQVMDKAGQTLDSHHNQIQQCKMAIKQSQEEMEQEKTRYIALRKEYQEHADRLTSLNTALEKCKSKNIDTQKILQEMHMQYQALKTRSDKMVAEVERLAKERNKYQEDLAVEQERVKAADLNLQRTQESLTAELKRTEHQTQQTYKQLDVCQKKGYECLETSKHQAEYIAKLESEIKHAMKVLKDEKVLLRQIQERDDAVKVKDQELLALKTQLAQLQEQNKQLKQTVQTFDSHHDADNDLLQRHAQLKAHHEKSLLWIEDMKRQHDHLRQQHTAVSQQLEKVTHKLNNSEEQMQKEAKVLREQDQDIQHVQKQIDKCLYPGEKERLESQLNEMIRDRERLRVAMTEATEKHGELYTRFQKLMKENEDLKVLNTRYEMDTKQMRTIVEQGAELNVELVKSRQLLSKKDEQLELLSTQLAALIHRVKVLEEREATLQEKLKYSAAPEEVENLTNHLNACRLEMKKNVAKYEAMQKIAHKVQEQNTLNQTKVKTLVEVLKETETTNMQLQQDREQRDQLHAALKECATERKVTTQELEARIQAIEKQYSANLLTHEKMMAESQSRIADLQQQLLQSAQLEKNTRLRELKHHGVPAHKEEVVTAIENNSERYIHELKTQLAALQAEVQDSKKATETAIKATNLKSAENLQQVRLLHQQAMREKEKQIMSVRDKTYDNLLAAIEGTNQNPQVNPQDVYAQVRDIRVQGSQREQQAMADMLKLRAINAKLAQEYRYSRQVQNDLLQHANNTQRNKILQQASAQPLDRQSLSGLKAHTDAYAALMNAQRNHILAQQRDVAAQLQDQQQYQQELQNQLYKMNTIEKRMNLERFPDLNVLQNQIGQEKRYTMNALNFENAEATGQARSLSALESQLKSVDASVRGMTEQVKRYIDQPSKQNLQNLQQMAQMSPGQIQTVLQNQQQLQDRSTVRTTMIIQPRPETAGPPGKSLAIDTSTGEVQIKATEANKPTQRYFGSQVALFEEPRQTFAPMLARAENQMDTGKDLVAITYSFDLNRVNQAGNNLKYVVFLHALKELFPKIQAMSRNGSVDVQLVRILPFEERTDLIANMNLTKGCTYQRCNAKKQTVKDVTSALSLMNQFTANFNNNPQVAEDHMVMTLSTPQSKGKIHIADVLFHPDASGNIPTEENIKLLDSSVITYLSEVIQQPDVKIDLFFNVLPFAEGDKDMHVANDRLLQVSRRVQTFLSQVHSNQ